MWRGAVAQLGERLNGIQEVVGSIPIGSTKFLRRKNLEHWSIRHWNNGEGFNAVQCSIVLLLTFVHPFNQCTQHPGQAQKNTRMVGPLSFFGWFARVSLGSGTGAEPITYRMAVWLAERRLVTPAKVVAF